MEVDVFSVVTGAIITDATWLKRCCAFFIHSIRHISRIKLFMKLVYHTRILRSILMQFCCNFNTHRGILYPHASLSTPSLFAFPGPAGRFALSAVVIWATRHDKEGVRVLHVGLADVFHIHGGLLQGGGQERRGRRGPHDRHQGDGPKFDRTTDVSLVLCLFSSASFLRLSVSKSSK